MKGLNFLGIELNEARNAENAAVISTDASRVTVRVIRTDEELMIARSVSACLDPAASETHSDDTKRIFCRIVLGRCSHPIATVAFTHGELSASAI